MKRTKMVQLAEVIRMINTQIEQAKDESTKETLCNMASDLLHSHDMYRGFMYNFWTSDMVTKYDGDIHLAIASGEGTEYDRYYFYLHI